MSDKELRLTLDQTESSMTLAQNSSQESVRLQHDAERLERLFRNKDECADDLYLLALITRYRKT